MPLSRIDYEKVDLQLMSVIHMLNSIEAQIASAGISKVPNTDVFITAIDDYRNEIALEVERQGKR